MILLSSQSCSITRLGNALLLGEASLLMRVFTPLGWLIKEGNYWLVDDPGPHPSVVVRVIARGKRNEGVGVLSGIRKRLLGFPPLVLK